VYDGLLLDQDLSIKKIFIKKKFNLNFYSGEKIKVKENFCIKDLDEWI